METTIDRFGRVVIPKKIRDGLGLKAGDSLSVEEKDSAVLIRPVREGGCLVYKGNVLVYTGKLEGDMDVVNLIRKHREERIQKFIRQGQK